MGRKKNERKEKIMKGKKKEGSDEECKGRKEE